MDEAGRGTAAAHPGVVTPRPDWGDHLKELADVRDRIRRTQVLVAVEDGRVLGTVTLELTGRTESGRRSPESSPLEPGEAHVRMLGVAPGAQGRGIGRMLMEACLDEARR